LITFCTAARWWAFRVILAEREITTENDQPRVTECIGESYKKRGTAVCSCSMRQDQGISLTSSRQMKKSSNRKLI
jgi:hypothetical protein